MRIPVSTISPKLRKIEEQQKKKMFDEFTFDERYDIVEVEILDADFDFLVSLKLLLDFASDSHFDVEDAVNHNRYHGLHVQSVDVLQVSGHYSSFARREHVEVRLDVDDGESAVLTNSTLGADDFCVSKIQYNSVESDIVFSYLFA